MLDTVTRESICQPEQPGLEFPQRPQFAMLAQERRHRQERLVAACRAFAVHEMHPDILTMCHAHAVYGVAHASLGKPLPPVMQDAAGFFEDHFVIADEVGKVAVEEAAGLNVAKAFKVWWFRALRAARVR